MSALILMLLVLGAVLLVAEAHVVSFGVLGVAGVAALVAAAALAVDAAGGGTLAALAVAVPVAGVCGAGVLLVATKALAATRQRPVGGRAGLVGRIGVVRRAVAPVGDVLVAGELWRAHPSWDAEDEPAMLEGEHVVVERVQGLTVAVRRAEEWEVRP